MSKEIPKILDFPENRENPFVPNLIIPKGKKNVVIARSDKMLMSRESGEVDEETLFIAAKKDVDKEQFVKIFLSNVQALFDLSKSTLKVFSYFASITEFGDKVIFDLEDCKEYTGYSSRQTIYRAIADLLAAEVIARTSANNLFFINPQIFYKGDRIVLMTEYRKKKIPKSIPGPELPFPDQID